MKHSRRLASTAISSVEWDDETGELDVQFVSGQVYTHPNVPQDVFEALVDAPSAGRYYGQFIKGQY